MAHEQAPETVTFKCSYCGSLITATRNVFRVTEICPDCRGSVIIPRRIENAKASAPLIPDGIPIKESGEWPAAHYARPGALRVDSSLPQPSVPPAPDTAHRTPSTIFKLPVNLLVAQFQPSESAPQPPPVAPPTERVLVGELADVATPTATQPIVDDAMTHTIDTKDSLRVVSDPTAPETSHSINTHDQAVEHPRLSAFSHAVVAATKTHFNIPASEQASVDPSVPAAEPTAPSEPLSAPASLFETPAAVTTNSSDDAIDSHASQPAVPHDPTHPTEKPTESRMMAIPTDIAAHVHPEPALPVPPPEIAQHVQPPHEVATTTPHVEPPPTKVIEKITPLSIEKLNAPKPVDLSASQAFKLPPQVTVPAPIDDFSASHDPVPTDSTGANPTRRSSKALEPTYAVRLAPDGMPVPPPAAQVSVTPPSAYMPKPKGPGVRWLLVAATLAIFIGAGYWIYSSVLNGLALENQKSHIESIMSTALRELVTKNDVQAAVSYAKNAHMAMELPASAGLEKEFKDKTNAVIKTYLDAGAADTQIQNEFIKAQHSEKELQACRESYNQKSRLWEQQKSPEFAALLAILHKKEAELNVFETEQKLAKLHGQLSEAEKLYVAGTVEDAAKIADEILVKMKDRPVVQDQLTQKRAEIISERATKLAAISTTANAASGPGIVLARKAVQAEIDKLDPKSDDLKPMLDRYTALLSKLEKAESAQFTATARRLMLEADSLHNQGKLENAAKLAAQIIASATPKLIDNNRALITRAEMFVDHNKKLERANAIRAAAKGERIADAQKTLKAEVDSLAQLGEDAKPLVERINVLRGELAQEERALKAEAARLAPADGSTKTLSANDGGALLKVLKLFQDYDSRVVPGDIDGDGYAFKFDGKQYKLGIRHEVPKKTSIFVQCDDNLIMIDPRHFGPGDYTFHPRWHRALYHAMALGDAMKKAGVKSDQMWDSKEEAPFVSARRFDKNGIEYVFLGNRLYTGKAQEKTDQQKKVEGQFRAQAEALALAVEKDAETSEEIRKTISFAIRASAVHADWNDQLEGEFVRKVIDEGYIESNMPGSAERLKKELSDYRSGYKMISEPFVNFVGNCTEGEATELRTFEDRAVWRMYDKATDITSFAITNPDDEKDCLFIVYDFAGKLTDMPDGKPPVKVRMTHQAVGVISSYDPTTNKMDYDKATWDFAAKMELPAIRDSDRINLGYGSASWAHPPHVLLIDKTGRTKALVTPYGRVDVVDFKTITDETKRKAAMDAYMDRLITVLPSKSEGCYQHLYFRYFFQYTFDSPVNERPNLLGSRGHTGDIHQTTYQSLGRLMGGRYVGDCDDIAELFMSLQRKMGKLSYVLSLPGHAACGWVEKYPDDKNYSFYVLQTGPALKFQDTSLDKVVERTYRSFDPEGTAHFDPKSLALSFRFNNEPTRTTYWLSSRMFVDSVYGEAMERVQSYWHFHFYALGIETMKYMIEQKGDRVSENWNEIAGLYGQVREIDKSIECSRESIKNLAASEKLSRMSEEYRIASMWRSEHENEKSYDAISTALKELKALNGTPESFDYLGMRMQMAGLLLALERPWEAWDLLRTDISILGNAQHYSLKLDHVSTLTSCYLKMKDLIGNRKILTAAENRQMKELAKVLEDFYSNGKAIFEDSDGFDGYMRKYASVGVYYAGKYGRKKLVEELLKDGPYPDINSKRNHKDRRNTPELVEEDWKWIRLSLTSYYVCIGDAIDLDDPPEKWRVDEAIKLCDQLRKAGVVAAKYGSLSTFKFILASNRVLRDFLKKDWKDLEEVIKETAEQNWARGTTEIAETFGKGARFCTPEEFATQYRMFTKHIKSMPTYFTIVYEAYRADGIPHAIAASKIALELNPDNLDMKREAAYLEKLAVDRMKKLDDKKAIIDAKAKEKADKEAKEKAAKEAAEKAATPPTK